MLRGDAVAWRTLYDHAFPGLWVYTLARVGRNRAAAEDVVQDVWMVAVRRIADFDPRRGSFESWVKGIAANLLRNRYRRERRAPAQLPLSDGTPRMDRDSVVDDEAVLLAVTSLPWSYQQVLRQKYIDQQSTAQIAAHMGQTEKSIESMLTRARVALRAALTGGSASHFWSMP